MPGTLRSVTWALGGLVDLVLPAACAGCGEPGQELCAGCAALLARPAAGHRPDPAPAGLPPVWAVAAYDGAVRTIVVAHKEHGRLRLARALGDALATSALAAMTGRASGPVVLVPAPSRPAAVRARGHDPTRSLARRAAAALRDNGVPVAVRPVLRVRRGLADQAGLDAAQRGVNLAGAHRVPPRLAPLVRDAPVLIVDDVVTTGATLAEAARALRVAGADVRGAAVVAATQRRRTGGAGRPGLSPGGQEY